MKAKANISRAARLMGWLEKARVAGKPYGAVGALALANPRKQEPMPDIINPAEEQIRAMVQGIYESKFVEMMGVPFYDAKGRREDVNYATHLLEKLKKAAFRIAMANAQKFGFLERPAPRLKLQPTRRCREASEERYHNYDVLLDNRQAYEETLALTRKAGYYRVTLESTVQNNGLFLVWPLLPGQRAPKPYATLQAAQKECDRRNRESDPRKTGRWWRMPEKKITKSDLKDWLPPKGTWSIR